MNYLIVRVCLKQQDQKDVRIKELHNVTDYDAQKEIEKFNRLARKHNFEFAYIYVPLEETIEIPVFKDTTFNPQMVL